MRLTAASFALVGDFENTVYCWRTQARAWAEPDAGVVLAAGAGAMGVRLGMPVQDVEGLQPRPELGVGEAADGPFLDSTVGLLWRALVLWVFVLLVRDRRAAALSGSGLGALRFPDEALRTQSIPSEGR